MLRKYAKSLDTISLFPSWSAVCLATLDRKNENLSVVVAVLTRIVNFWRTGRERWEMGNRPPPPTHPPYPLPPNSLCMAPMRPKPRWLAHHVGWPACTCRMPWQTTALFFSVRQVLVVLRKNRAFSENARLFSKLPSLKYIRGIPFDMLDAGVCFRST